MKAQKISQYNIDGTFIKTFNSLNEAMRSVPGTTSLGNVFHLHKDGYFAGGFFWKAEGEDHSLVIPENEYFDSNKQKRVNQYSENGEYNRTFDSIIEPGFFPPCCNFLQPSPTFSNWPTSAKRHITEQPILVVRL